MLKISLYIIAHLLHFVNRTLESRLFWGFGRFGSRNLSPFSGWFSLPSGRFSFFGEFLLDVDGVAGNILTALTKEEPDENENGATEGEEAVFDGVGPVGSEENDGVNDTETDGVEIAASEDDFLREREVALREGIFCTVVGVAEEFTVEN